MRTIPRDANLNGAAHAGPASRPRRARPAPLAEQLASLGEQALLIVDPRGRIEFCSPATRQLLNDEHGQLLGRSLSSVIPALPLRPETPGYNCAYFAFHFPHARWHPVQGKTCDGRQVHMEVSFVLLPVGREQRILATLRPSAPIEDAQGELAGFIAEAHGRRDVVVVTALDGLIRYVNPAYERITGFAAHEVMGKTQRVVQSGVHPPSFYRALWEALRGGQAHRAVFSNRARSGEIFHLEEELRPFTDRRGNTIGYVSIGRDISHQVRADEALRHRANYDSLTGVANRHLLMDTVQHEIARARRERGNFTVVCADLDGLKGINDHHGHAAGDAALCAISKRLADTVREMDVVGRLGGDEFLLILPGMHRRGDIESSLRKLVDSVRSIEVGKDLPVTVTLSAGAATFPFDATDVEGLMRAADAAMYRAKLRGGNGFWVPGMDRAPRLRTRDGSVLAEVPRLCIAHLDEGNVRSDTLGARA